MLKLYAAYLIFMSTVDFFLMMSDKQLAKRHRRRIPERVLFGWALFGGSYGGFLAMRLFRHKTRHPKFYVGFPVLIVVHTVLTAALIATGVL